MTRKQKVQPRAYHHGDLRNALIIAAAELIEESGSVDFAMIDAARRAGVSSAAPYRHFRDKAALLDAVLEFAFFALSLEMDAVTRNQERGSIEAIVALGQAYIRFVTGHPQFYDLMWGDRDKRFINDVENELRSSGFYLLVATVEAWCQRSGRDGEDALTLSIKLWAMAHGLSGIAMHGHVERFLPQADVYSLLESSTHTFLEGVRRGV
tara:strand:+ start:50092 stop:50718 length:627 start_codon:yes stop_codon:yes gene_type:complete